MLNNASSGIHTANKILREFTMLLVIKKRHSGILYNAKAKVNLKPP
jgi:hypothetical protein